MLAMVVGLPTAASASHYRLPANGLVTDGELAALTAQGITDTKRLLDRVAPLASRKALAKATRIALPRLLELAQKCDLLRVAGVGPTMMRLLQAAGVVDSRALGKSGAAALGARMRAANATKGISEVVPSDEVLADWIGQARRLPRLVE